MIENIYSSEAINGNPNNKANTKIKTPKNVRQIGKIGDNLKIYVEDYVKTYAKQLAENDYSERCIAVLIGEYRVLDGEKDVFIYGAIGTCDAYAEGKIEFSEEIWTSVYEMIKQYFPEGEIVGWYFGGASFGMEETNRLQQVHIDNFAGRDKVLLTYDILDKEDNFYLYDNGYMVLQPGYYIYYEKNDEMQNYMVDHKHVKNEELIVDDHAIKEIRTKLQEKKQPAVEEKDQKVMLRLAYAAGTLMTVVALLVGVTVMNNSEKMKSLEQALNTISNRLTTQKENNLEENAQGNIFNEGDDESVPVLNNQGSSKDNSENSIDENGNPVSGNVTTTPDKNEDETTTDGPDLSPEGSDTGAGNEETNNNEPTNTSGSNESTSSGEPLDSESAGEITGAPSETTNTETENTNTEASTPDSEASNNNTQETGGIDVTKLRTYTVKSGDTIANICMKMYNSYANMQTIKELNQLVDENKIFIGQELLIP